MMASLHGDNVTLDRVEYEALLRDRALAEKVRGMLKGTALQRGVYGVGVWAYFDKRQTKHLGNTPEAALGIEEVGDV
jgi:hypothetical protein